MVGQVCILGDAPAHDFVVRAREASRAPEAGNTERGLALIEGCGVVTFGNMLGGTVVGSLRSVRRLGAWWVDVVHFISFRIDAVCNLQAYFGGGTDAELGRSAEALVSDRRLYDRGPKVPADYLVVPGRETCRTPKVGIEERGPALVEWL